MNYFPRFVFPEALILLLLVPWSIWIGARIQSLTSGRKWTAISIRTVILLCLILALAGAELVMVEDKLAVFFLLDHSDSVSEDARLESAQWVRNVAGEFMTDRDKAGVIVFGEEASIELSAAEKLGMREIMSYVGGEHTDIASAVRLALAAFPQGHKKRMVIYTDGNETRGSALEEVKAAQAAGVAVDVVPLWSAQTPEVRIREVHAPSRAESDEPFQLRIVVQADQDTEATIRVFRRVGEERRLLPEQKVTLHAGDNTFILTQELVSSGFYEYEVSIESEADTVLANNEGRAFTVVQGEPRVLYVEGDPAHSSYLGPALRAEGIAVDRVGPGSIPTSLAQFQNYDAVILSNVSSTDMSMDQMHSIEAMVRDLGIGLVMVGGPDSFGAGGYLGTPIEKALPVDMDIKQRKVLPQGALALIMHTCEFPNGNAWAREIALAALNVLSARDQMGLLAYLYPRGDQWIFTLQEVGSKTAMRKTIRRASTQIGDMPDIGPTLQMAYTALSRSTAAAKRIIMISDGDPQPPSASLVAQLRNAGIAVSTVCINPHSPSDSTKLKNLADATGGQFYFVTNPSNLPQIFTKEAAIVKRGMMIEEPFTPVVNHDSELLFGLADTPLPELQGYVVTTAKENATVPLLSHEGDPILAHWRYGLGKAVAFTSDATNRWAADWLSWEGFDRFWAQTVRWSTRELTESSFQIDTTVRNGMGHVKVDAVDKDGKFINFLRPRGVVTGPAPDFKRREIELLQTGPGIYESTFPLERSGVYMMNLLYEGPDGTRRSIPAGLALGYSPEYEYTTTNLPLLEQTAAAGGGIVRDPDSNPFEHSANLVATPSVTPIWHLLAIVAVCLFPFEIFVRRVVVPFAAIYAPVAKVLGMLPAVGRLIPKPKPRAAPTTGQYYTAAESRDFTAEGEAPPSFGTTVTPEAAVSEPSSSEVSPAEPGTGRSEYTKQLLAAKERAIARKTRRIDSTRDREE